MWRACRLFLIFLVGLAGFGFPHPAAAAIDVQTRGRWDRLSRGDEHAGDQSDRLFLVQQSGKILIYMAVALTATPDPGPSMFAGWTGDADCADGTVTLSADRHCSSGTSCPYLHRSRARGPAIRSKLLLRSSDSESLRTVGILESFPLQFRPPEIQNHTR